MPPRTRRQGSAAATGGPATAAGTAGLLDLPGALLEIVLSLLTHEER